MNPIPSPLRRAIFTAALATLALCAGPASAQEPFPSKPIRVVVPYTPGGVSDAVTRLVTKKLSEQLKTPIIVDNQPGANGQIGSSAVVRSAPDGYTLLVVVAAHVINPSLYSKMTYAPLQDLRGVSEIGAIPLLMVSSAALPPANLKDFVAWVKANPQSATFASSGTGSGAHLAAELFAQTIGAPITHVPYKGIAPALPDLFAGQIATIFDSVQTMMPHVKAGKLHALAITSNARWPAAPDVPTMNEQGYPGMTGGSWIGMLAPAKTPDDIVGKLSAEMQNVVDSPEVRAKLIEYGIDPVGGTPAQFDAFMQGESKRWADVVKKADIRIE
ncbi:MAG: tripartite tricarboxylate transporter substrate binding protein [Burkholderiaceae bacterium]|jgi:tripartite-type tricarboxylate transporter receptor subunit TctC|nr:tripartite tricarboxylate transporter substrate binding protein [Burkholderiaceae bacterium]